MIEHRLNRTAVKEDPSDGYEKLGPAQEERKAAGELHVSSSTDADVLKKRPQDFESFDDGNRMRIRRQWTSSRTKARGSQRVRAPHVRIIISSRLPPSLLARTNLSIDKEVFEEFASEADRRRMTLFAFANEALSAITKISREGGDPEDFYRIWRVISILREVDVITLPSDFVDGLIESQYNADADGTKAKFRQLGESLVGLLKMAAEDLENLAPLAQDFGFFVPIKHFELRNREGKVIVDVVGAGKAIETTRCSSEFLKAILTGYGYVTTKEELHPGTIRLIAQKSGSS